MIEATWIHNGFYRISDADAEQLARDRGLELPEEGHDIKVMLEGRLWWLQRTPLYWCGGEPVVRGWVWSIYSPSRRRSSVIKIDLRTHRDLHPTQV